MTVLSGQSIQRRCTSAMRLNKSPLITPFDLRRVHEPSGMSYGISAAGYDLRIAQDVLLSPGHFQLASTVERFTMPNDLIGIVHDKSTHARRGLAVQNTVIEPGWEGYLTLELSNHNDHWIRISAGTPIAQVVFHRLDAPTEFPYSGKYQNQEEGPQEARFEQLSLPLGD